MQFGLHGFMRLCALTGSEPYLAANVGSGTPKAFNDWVGYYTDFRPTSVKGESSNAREWYAVLRGFAYVGSRDGKASVCILAGVDADAIADVIRAFAALKSVTASGFVLAID